MRSVNFHFFSIPCLVVIERTLVREIGVTKRPGARGCGQDGKELSKKM